jgi:protein tyrosine phosphatase
MCVRHMVRDFVQYKTQNSKHDTQNVILIKSSLTRLGRETVKEDWRRKHCDEAVRNGSDLQAVRKKPVCWQKDTPTGKK